MVKCYFRSFKQNFLQSVIISVILVALTLFFSYDIYVTFKWADGSHGMVYRLLFFAVAGITAVMALGGLYVFPMIAKFYNSTGKMIKNSVMMAVANLPQAILMAIISAAMVLLIRVNPYSLAFAIGISGYLKSMILVKVFDKYIPKVDDEDSEENLEEDLEENAEVAENEERIVITEADMNQGLATLMGNAYRDDEELMEDAEQEEDSKDSEE